MTKTENSKTRASRKKEQLTAVEIPENPAGVLDTMALWLLRFDRFKWDVLGLFLMTVALITVIGLFKPDQGVFINFWVELLKNWLGLGGAWVVTLLIGGCGILVLLRKFSPFGHFNLGKVLAVEIWFFVVLALMSILGGMGDQSSLERAEKGLDGGKIGWGLAEGINRALPSPLGVLFLVFLFVALGLYCFGLLDVLAKRLHPYLTAPEEPEPLLQPEYKPAPPVEVQRVRAQPLPMDDPEEEDETPHPLNNMAAGKSGSKPAAPLARDERLPPLNLLLQEQAAKDDESGVIMTAKQIETSLQEFGIPARVIGYRRGPTVTQYAVEPGFIERTGPDGNPMQQKVRVSQIAALQRDLALTLSAERLRIEAPVPGESFVGIEVPNTQGATVRLRALLESDAFMKLNSPLAIALGRDVSGQPVVADLARMPHMLIAGTTGSGKSVCISALTLCLAMNNLPSELKIAMLDPKMVELVRFNGLPHLLGKVEVKTDRMLGILRWAINEMDHRYRLLEDAKARDIQTYNRRMERRKLPTLPRIVVLIDELADLMMSAPDETEHNLVRLAQMARATGIHLVVATQRPSTDVVTGLIKANFPARISFSVASSVDSRVILDTSGAESLLGRGDMLFLNPENGTPMRAQGAIVTDQEMDKVIEFWRKMSPTVDKSAPWEELLGMQEDDADKLVNHAIEIVRSTRHASASMLQRRLRIGYPRAARLIDELEELGVVGPSQGGGREREVLIEANEDEDGGDLAPGEEY
ncbi:MAG: DNA translocase FtsK [Anaerolineae bacterium]|nr:DNA translocase FtsK [Anaerolineae bacterium]